MDAYAIGELAAEFGITPRAIRHYEALGLLQPQRPGKHRRYSRQDRVRLGLILRNQRLGLSLEDIRDLFGLYDGARQEPARLNEFLERIAAHRARLEQQKTDAEAMLGEIAFFEQLCRSGVARQK